MSDDSGANQQALYTAAQYHEHLYQNGLHDPEANTHALTVRDPKVSRWLSVVENGYDVTATDAPEHMPGMAEDLEDIRRTRSMAATETGRKAMQEGDMLTLKAQTGDAGQQADISGIKAMERVDNLVTGKAPVVVVLGEMGAGKSNAALLFGQRWKHHNPSGLVGTNISSLREKTSWEDKKGRERDGYLPHYPVLQNWVRHEGDPQTTDQTPKLAILDELSSKGDGSGKSGQKVRKLMGPLVFKIRKYGGALIVIAHDESSIHPLLWRVGTIVKKIDLKKMVIAEKVKNGELRGISEPIVGVPETDWRYDDKDPAPWSWSESESEGGPEMDEIEVKQVSMWTIRECMDAGMSPRETAEFVPYSHTTVGNWWEDYQDGGEKTEWVSTVEAVIA